MKNEGHGSGGVAAAGAQAPLAGIKVLSLAEQLPGPFAGLLLADMGADVVIVERPVGGDPARAYPGLFEAFARNKRSVTIDLKTAEGRADFLALAASADVVLEGYSPGTARRLGIDFEALRAVNRGLVYASISGFGQSGAYRDRAAHDISYQAVTGFLSALGGGATTNASVPIADVAAAIYCVAGVNAALLGRSRTGEGCYLDLSMTDCLVSLVAPLLLPRMNGQSAPEAHATPAYGLFECACGRQLSLSVVHEDHFWRRLCTALGLDDLCALDEAARARDADRLRTLLAERIAAFPLAHWSEVLDAARVAWSPVLSMEEVSRDPHFMARGLFESLVNDRGVQMHLRSPLRFGCALPALAGAPQLGEHTESILRPRST
jgi:crotonobetainyl-CoA:carnitine CoA-transferase CaiB-like acyl-CoA transferase